MIYLDKPKYISTNYEKTLDLCGNRKKNIQKVSNILILYIKFCNDSWEILNFKAPS